MRKLTKAEYREIQDKRQKLQASKRRKDEKKSTFVPSGRRGAFACFKHAWPKPQEVDG